MHANSRGGISIPIQVSGAAEAQRDIKDVADEVHEVSAAGGASVPVTAPGAARAKQELDSVEQSVRKLRASAPPNWAVVNFPEGRLAQAKEAAGAIDGISAQGEKAAKTILSLLNPALGGMLSLVIDLAQGIMKFSPALIVLTSVATAVGLITAALGAAAEAANKANEAIMRMAEAQRKQRDARRDERQKIADELVKGGVGASATPAVQADIQRQMNEGMSEPLARSASMFRAREVLAAGDVRAFQAGVIAAGGQAPSLTGDSDQDRRIVADLVARGRAPQAQQALDEYIQQTSLNSKFKALGAGSVAQSGVDYLLDRLKREAGLNDADVQSIREYMLLLQTNGPELEAQAKLIRHSQTQVPRWFLPDPDAIGVRVADGSSLSRGQIAAQARRLSEQMAAEGIDWQSVPGNASTTLPSSPAPVQINNTTNNYIGQQNVVGRDGSALRRSFNPSVAAGSLGG
jgi:hypothetical protein